DVADRLPETVPIRDERAHGGGRGEAVLDRVLARERALEDVRAPSARVNVVIAPRVLRALEAAARRVLPLRLGREASVGPRTVGLGVVPADVHDGVVVETVDR